MANFGNPGSHRILNHLGGHLAQFGELVWFTLADSVELTMLMG